MLLQFILSLAATLIIDLLIILLVLWVLKNAIVYAQISLSLIIAMMLQAWFPLLNGGWLGYGLWAAICIGVCYLLCRIPRISFALCFTSTLWITTLIGWALLNTFGLSSDGWVIALKIIVSIFSFVVILPQFKSSGDWNYFSNPILIIMERIVGTFVYTVGLILIINSSNLLLFCGIFAVMYTADLLLLGR